MCLDVALDQLKIRPTNCAGFDLDHQFERGGLEIRLLDELERRIFDGCRSGKSYSAHTLSLARLDLSPGKKVGHNGTGTDSRRGEARRYRTRRRAYR
jgi:hypothetical protein